MQNLNDCCPHCGGDSGLEWKDYGLVLHYIANWGHGQENTDTSRVKKRPTYGACIDCGKRVKLRGSVSEFTISNYAPSTY